MDCRHGAVRRCDILRKVVDHPVRQIFDAVERNSIDGFSVSSTRLSHDLGSLPVNFAMVSTARLIASAWSPIYASGLNESVPMIQTRLECGRRAPGVDPHTLAFNARVRHVASVHALNCPPEAGAHPDFCQDQLARPATAAVHWRA